MLMHVKRGAEEPLCRARQVESGPLGDGHRLERNLRLGSEIQRLVAAIGVRAHAGLVAEHRATCGV